MNRHRKATAENLEKKAGSERYQKKVRCMESLKWIKAHMANE